MTLQVASLFTGVGGIDLAFERAGAPTRLMCEYDKAARQMGNAVAVPVFEWVARRLMVEDSLRDRKAAS